MKKELLENNIIDFLYGEKKGDVSTLQQIMSSHSDANQLIEEYNILNLAISQMRDVEPPQEIRNAFSDFLYKKTASKEKTSIYLSNKILLVIVFLVLLVLSVGLYIGTKLNVTQQAEPYPNFASTDKLDSKYDMLKLLGESETNYRIKGINMSNSIEVVDNEIILALSKTLLNDHNDHVRLAAVEALWKFSDEPGVRETLLKAIEQETDETIIIALINILSEIKEREALKSFDKIINNKKTIQFVKDEAYSGKLKIINAY